MILGMWVGSKGSGEVTFTVRVPINVSPLSSIRTTPGESPLSIGGYPAALFLEHELLILEVYGFASEEAAYEALPGIQAGLICAALCHGIALPFPGQTAPVVYDKLFISGESEMNKPFVDKGWDRLDGHFPWDYTVVKPEHKKLSVEAVASGRVVPVIQDHTIAQKISEAMELSQPEKVLDDERLRLALNLYSSSFFQFDDNARFITLVNVLEALNPNRPATEDVKTIVDGFIDQIRKVRDSLDKTDPESGFDEYSNLMNRIGYLKRESIGKGIRSLVTETLRLYPDVRDPETVAKEASRVYGLRSTLVHEGSIPPEDLRAGIESLMDIVPRVLFVLSTEAAK